MVCTHGLYPWSMRHGTGQVLTTIDRASDEFTVLAPSNAAFDRLAAATVASLTDPPNAALARAAVLLHIVRGVIREDEMKALAEGGGMLRTLSGEALRLHRHACTYVLAHVQTHCGCAASTAASSSQRTRPMRRHS